MLLATDGQVDLATVQMALAEELSAGAASEAVGIGSGPLADRVQSFEREVILAELKRSHHNMSMAAKSLGLERSHLYKKAEQLGIDLRTLRREQGASGLTPGQLTIACAPEHRFGQRTFGSSASSSFRISCFLRD